MKRIRFVVAGAGVVGRGLLELWKKNRESIQKKWNLDLDLVGIATRSPEKGPSLQEFATTISKNPLEILSQKPDLAIELMGGTGDAYQFARSVLEQGRPLVTANKALLSEKGPELFALAESQETEIGFEAAVAGSIPIIRTIRNGLSSCDFQSIAGILNGTTNFILSKMEEENWDYGVALKKAQELGFAEADPTFDVEGIDAGHKLSLLASLAFQKHIPFSQITVKGISSLRSIDIQMAKYLGFRIKLIAMSQKKENGITADVSPRLVPLHHPLANVMKELNAVFYQTIETGPGMLTGKGAGSLPTASAVLADLVYYGLRCSNPSIPKEKNSFPESKVQPLGNSQARFYLRFSTIDKPGVLAEIAHILGQNGISIATVQQQEASSEPVHVIVVTHFASIENLQKSILSIDSQNHIIKEKTIAIPLMENL